MSTLYVVQNDRDAQGDDLEALRGLLFEAIEKAKPAKRKPVVLTTDIARLSCKQLVGRIIRDRGEQAAAVLATKLNHELARRGKERAVMTRAARNGNGAGLHGSAD